MFYSNFDSLITAKYSVVVVGWPLAKFQSPSDVGSMTELKVLLNAWKTGVATFRKMSQVEWEQWDDENIQRVSQVDGANNESNNLSMSASSCHHACFSLLSFCSSVRNTTYDCIGALR